MSSPYYFNAKTMKTIVDTASGSFKKVTSDEVSGLVNTSFGILTLKKGAGRAPMWHPNAHKIGYCQQGSAYISLRTPSSVETFAVETGDVFFIPQGYVHNFINSSSGDTLIAMVCNHVQPETMHLSNAFNSLSDSVCTATFKTSSGFAEGLKKAKKADEICPMSAPAAPYNATSPYK
jgi:oxalate decarboxylase